MKFCGVLVGIDEPQRANGASYDGECQGQTVGRGLLSNLSLQELVRNGAVRARQQVFSRSEHATLCRRGGWCSRGVGRDRQVSASVE